MLIGIEYEHCQKLLKFLSLEDILSLKNTITKGLIATEDVQGIKSFFSAAEFNNCI